MKNLSPITLAEVSASGVATNGVVSTHKLPYTDIEHAYGPDCGFVLHALLAPSAELEALNVVFRTATGRLITANVQAMAHERDDILKGMLIFIYFLSLVAREPVMKRLDFGGRARSRDDRILLFASADCTVLDILPGDNVDMLGGRARDVKVAAAASC